MAEFGFSCHIGHRDQSRVCTETLSDRVHAAHIDLAVSELATIAEALQLLTRADQFNDLVD